MAEVDPDILTISRMVGHFIQRDYPSREYGPYRTIDPKHAQAIADILQTVVAEVIACLIDAGSEREAVMEDEALNAMILSIVHDFSGDPREDKT